MLTASLIFNVMLIVALLRRNKPGKALSPLPLPQKPADRPGIDIKAVRKRMAEIKRMERAFHPKKKALAAPVESDDERTAMKALVALGESKQSAATLLAKVKAGGYAGDANGLIRAMLKAR